MAVVGHRHLEHHHRDYGQILCRIFSNVTIYSHRLVWEISTIRTISSTFLQMVSCCYSYSCCCCSLHHLVRHLRRHHRHCYCYHHPSFPICLRCCRRRRMAFYLFMIEGFTQSNLSRIDGPRALMFLGARFFLTFFCIPNKIRYTTRREREREREREGGRERKLFARLCCFFFKTIISV